MQAFTGQTFARERRRLAAVTGVAFLAGSLFYVHADAQIAGIPIFLFFGFAYAMIVAPAAYLVFALLPAGGVVVEAVAVSRLGLSIAIVSLPERAAMMLGSPALMAAFVIGGSLIVRPIIAGAAPTS